VPKNKKRPYTSFFQSPGILIFTAIFGAVGTFFILRAVAYNQGTNYDVQLTASKLDNAKGTVLLTWSTPLGNNNLRYCVANTALQKVGSNFSNQNTTEWSVVGHQPTKPLNGSETVYFFGGTRGYYHTFSLICYNSKNVISGFSNPATVVWL
jgi:hypothetical protein